MDLNQEQISSKNAGIFLDEMDIEDIPFVPITDGLGFNNKKKTLNNAQNSMAQKRVVETHEKIYNSITTPDNQNVKIDGPSELNAFYSSPRANSSVQRELKFEKKIKRESSIETRFWAWLADTAIISFLFSIILGTMFLSTNISLSEFKGFILTDYNIIFPIMLFTLIHVLYQITTGFQATIGQKILGITPDFDEIKGDIFFFLLKRSLLELLSISTIGILFLLGFDKKILGNKVVIK